MTARIEKKKIVFPDMAVSATATPMTLQFHVGPIPYSVVLSDRPIYDSEGCQLEACALEGRRLIVLSKILEPVRREEIAQHEFYHCWLFHVPAPRTEEEAAQLHSLIARQFQNDLNAAGGSAAFQAMQKTPIIVGKPLDTSSRIPFRRARRLRRFA